MFLSHQTISPPISLTVPPVLSLQSRPYCGAIFDGITAKASLSSRGLLLLLTWVLSLPKVSNPLGDQNLRKVAHKPFRMCTLKTQNLKPRRMNGSEKPRGAVALALQLGPPARPDYRKGAG